MPWVNGKQVHLWKNITSLGGETIQVKSHLVNAVLPHYIRFLWSNACFFSQRTGLCILIDCGACQSISFIPCLHYRMRPDATFPKILDHVSFYNPGLNFESFNKG